MDSKKKPFNRNRNIKNNKKINSIFISNLCIKWHKDSDEIIFN